ncbi:helix-turn-helix transcriptional regulator [Sutcliffiella horikoshii]|uniref:Helix-turn-helix transcriptional regulator n=2 Tax=Sutcliffiella horikoshii TaxID=79883 RepID=A0A5D4SA73_9BACI|nr:helix-turn-helix transcriptional regulator [Sutcliffiella horikoshii]
MEKSALKQFRNDAGLKISDAADQLEIPMGYLSLIETGKRSVTPERAKQIADLYGKKVSEIFLPSRYSVREVEQATQISESV